MGARDQGANAIQNRWLTIPRTLCFVQHGGDVLLMKRAPTRRIFPNRYNGIGGHIERDEDPYKGAIREIKEETGLNVEQIRLRGIHNIDAGQPTGIMMFVFTAVSISREFVDNGIEGTLHWVPVNEVNQLDLVEDLPYILPRVLNMQANEPPYFVHVSYNENDEIVMRFTGNE